MDHRGLLASPALDRCLPAFDVDEVHAEELPISPEEAIERAFGVRRAA